MFLLKNDNTIPSYNLAFEEYFTYKAADIGQPLIWFWRNRPSVIVGRFQSTYSEVNAAYAQQHKITVMRRITGGGAVYHDLSNINYSLILPGDEDSYLRIKESKSYFHILFDLIQGLLQKHGINAESSGRNDLHVNGKKVSGAAQQHTRRGTLLHGTLLFDTDLDTLTQVLNVDPAKFTGKGIQSVRDRVGNLKEYLGNMCASEFMSSLESSLGHPEYKLSQDDHRAIMDLCVNKYEKWNWTWGRSPAFTESKKKRFAWGTLEIKLNVLNGLIDDCQVYGDFFSLMHEPENVIPGKASAKSRVPYATRNLHHLSMALKGLRYKSEEMQKALDALPLERLFIGCGTDEVIEFFME